ncbi:N-6 DNA methylase [Ramlibacter sp. G-1-2-2]|uniref:N-6 DNA methylase n=1 Tax=Ramlibacter agri TaxID=2728837 RepID=A0A848H1B6_9BURK|nr:N-6 DNA methylase [Ramlibacter agri]NML42533.1 N-6 DNA methylase [Ramlibacter agri]
MRLTEAADLLASSVARVTAAAANEAQLRHEIELRLEQICGDTRIPWTAFQLERPLRSGTAMRFADVAHGALIIEYEPPNSFRSSEGAKLNHARAQAEEYGRLIAIEEGRDPSEYVLLAWDGASTSFGALAGDHAKWEPLTPFSRGVAERLLRALEQNGRPLVHPQLLQAWIGPDSEYGAKLVPLMFEAICEANSAHDTTKTKLLFTEWKRLFSQVVGFQPTAMRRLLERQKIAHSHNYGAEPAAYLFALNTYIAVIAKLVAACALPNAAQNVLDNSVSVHDRLQTLESGYLFESAGISNMLDGDFFSWYVDDPKLDFFIASLESILNKLSFVDFQITKKSPQTTRDLFKGIYERFIPREVRHALGEFYTPDWLAEHGMNQLGWTEEHPLTDPTCGTGTFLLEALRRRMVAWPPSATARQLLSGLHGIDLNPLAVLAAKASIVVFISASLSASDQIRIPIHLADAIDPPQEDLFGNYSHVLSTAIGSKEYRLPVAVVRHPDFQQLMARARLLIDADVPLPSIMNALRGAFMRDIEPDLWDVVEQTVANFVWLHERGWNGIWCTILAERFAAATIPPSTFVCGNPPWVRWSTLPKEYAKAIQPRCKQLGVFSGDKWVGGIEADVSTVVTFSAVERYLAPGGLLGFFLPGSVFTTESSAGFRQLQIAGGRVTAAAVRVEDFEQIRPFDGVTNHATFLILERDSQTTFPVPYSTWKLTSRPTAGSVERFANAAAFVAQASATEQVAAPVPGGQGRPWLVGVSSEQSTFSRVFAKREHAYIARKGVTTDRNGVFWLEILVQSSPGLLTVKNDPSIGKTRGIPQVTARVEDEHVFPLLRGRGVRPFNAVPDEKFFVLVPQRGMHGDNALPETHPLTYRYLSQFERELVSRGSFRRFQAGQAYYSVWSTGAYTFAPFKVVWREIGKEFAAAYIGTAPSKHLGDKVVVPDHKVYFIPVQTEGEAAYLTAYLNAPLVSRSISAYGAQLSLGTSVAEYLNIPGYVPNNANMAGLSEVGQLITRRGTSATQAELHLLDEYVSALLHSSAANATRS